MDLRLGKTGNYYKRLTINAMERLNVDETKKGEKGWQEKMVRSIINSCLSSNAEKAKDRFCYRFYNNVWDQREFDYVTKVGDYTYPARVTFTPIVKQDLEYLRSNMARRPFLYRIFAIDEVAMDRRQKAKRKLEIDTRLKRIRKQSEDFLAAQREALERKEMLGQQMQQEPESEEQAMQQQQLQEKWPEIERQFNLYIANLKDEMKLKDKEVAEIEKYMNYTYKDFVEEAAYDCFEESIQKLKLLYERLKAFTDKIICGKSIFLVDYQPGMKVPVFKRLQPTSTYWSNDSDNEWIQDGRWAAFKTRMNYNQILDTFKLPTDQRIRLEKLSQMYSDSTMSSTPVGGAVFDEDTLSNTKLYGGSRSAVGGIDVWSVFFRVPRKIYIKKSPNKYKEDDYFSHYSNEEPKINEKKGEKLEVRYVDDIWEGFLIGNDIVYGVKRRDIQNRDPETYDVKLPIYGLSYNSETDSPYSIVWATKDIQRESDLIRYYRHLMFALAGAKGIVMDKAQKPATMNTKEWLYNRKMGVTWIDSSRQKNARYNQFTNYDDTISPSIQYIDGMLLNLQELVHTITGVSRQSLGQVVATDQVRTNESSIRQSSLVTEILYYEADLVFAEACTGFLNVLRIAKNDGGLVSYENKDGVLQIREIPKEVFKDSKLKMFIRENTKNLENLRELKQLAYAAFSRGNISVPQMVQVITNENVVELERKLEYFAEKADEILALRSQEASEAEHQKEMMLKQFEQEFEKYIKEQEFELKDKELQIRQFEVGLKERELEMKAGAEMLNAELKIQELDSENAIEAAYLQEQNRAARMHEDLQALQIKINAMLQMMGMDKDIAMSNEKNKVELTKAKSKNKEHIKDN